MQMGVDIRKPFTAEHENVARLTLKQRWEAKGGSIFYEKVTDRDDSYSIEWASHPPIKVGDIVSIPGVGERVIKASSRG